MQCNSVYADYARARVICGASEAHMACARVMFAVGEAVWYVRRAV